MDIRGKHHRGKGKAFAWISEHVSYTGDDCIKWPFCSLRGRGMLHYLNEKWYAPRLMCTLAYGEPPTPEHEATHDCGKGHEGCMNPRHLVWKTRSGNRQDCKRPGTNSRGGGKSKLEIEQVREIRGLQGQETAYVVADRYGVSATAIYLIWQGRTFKAAA